MARSAPILPVNATMYRHFAIATVLITGCLAMFASGENRQAVENHLEARQNAAAAQATEQKLAAEGKGGNRKSNLTDRRKVKGGFGSDSDDRWTPPPRARGGGDFPGTFEAERVAGDYASGVDGSGPVTFSAGAGPQAGMSPEEMAQAKSQRKAKKKFPPPEAPMSQSQMEALMAASDARSRTRAD